MTKQSEDRDRFSDWLARPASLIALSAIVLSVCGLFVAVYETSLVRREQRASVWPHVEVAASLTRERIDVWVHNTGVGPARVRAAAVTYDGETKKDWEDMLRQVGSNPAPLSSYYSLVGGRVLPRDSEPETIFRVTADDGPKAPGLIERIRTQVIEGRIDVNLCYSSVYDECWTSSLQDVVKRSSGLAPRAGERSVDSCEGAPLSAI